MNEDNQHIPSSSSNYQITISGKLDPTRSAWFDGLEIQYQENVTVLSGRLVDEQALFGVIERIRDLGLKLIEVRRVDR